VRIIKDHSLRDQAILAALRGRSIQDPASELSRRPLPRTWVNKGNNGRVSSNLPPEGAPLRFGARTTLSTWLLALQARELGEPLTVLTRDLQEVSGRVQTPERRVHLQRPHP
jgi:hypothetical protein